MRHGSVFGLALSLVAGCASGGLKHAELKPVLPAIGEDQGRVFFFRKAYLGGAAIQPNIYLDGRVVGTSRPGGFFYVDARSGPHEASATTEARRALSFALDGNETKYIRTSPSFGILVGRINFELVDPAEAEKELRDLSYTGTLPWMAASVNGNAHGRGEATSGPAEDENASDAGEPRSGWRNPTLPGRRVVILGGGEHPADDASQAPQGQDAAQKTTAPASPDPRLPKPHHNPGDVTDTTQPSSTPWVDESHQ